MGLNVYHLFPSLPEAMKPNAQLVFYVLPRKGWKKCAVQIKYLREVTLEEKILVCKLILRLIILTDAFLLIASEFNSSVLGKTGSKKKSKINNNYR